METIYFVNSILGFDTDKNHRQQYWEKTSDYDLRELTLLRTSKIELQFDSVSQNPFSTRATYK